MEKATWVGKKNTIPSAIQLHAAPAAAIENRHLLSENVDFSDTVLL